MEAEAAEKSRCAGGWRLVGSNGEQPLRFIDAFEFVFVTVFERDACRRSCKLLEGLDNDI